MCADGSTRSSVSLSSLPPKPPEERLAALMDIANKIDFLHGLDIQQYFRVMRSMICAVDVYVQNNQKEAAYVLASKFVILYLQHLPRHREYASISATEKNQWNSRCRTLLGKAELLKHELRSRYEKELSDYKESEKEKELEEAKKEAERSRLQQEKRASVLGTLVPRSPSNKQSEISERNDVSDFPNTNRKQEPVNESVNELVPPTVDRNLKPMFHKTNVYGWSTVRVPTKLAQRFLHLADFNTKQNRETCGNLCGRMVGCEFHITDLVVLKQSGTSDSCTTHREEELFEYIEEHGLIVLGWIHTHPSQTAFLSSVDQHSQLSYQIMLPEAIAIVCAPKFNEIKTFSLTPTYGIQFVRQCKQIGFHPHTQASPIYEPSQHVVDDPLLPLNVLDLR